MWANLRVANMCMNNMKFACTLAASVFAMGLAVGAGPARAATVTDLITFSDSGSFPVNYPSGPNDVAYGFQGTVVTGSFDITFDPTKLYLTQPIAGIINNLNFTVIDPYFGGLLTLNPITSFAFDGAGTLTLDSNPALSKAMTVTPDITIGINGWAYGVASSVWYSQDGFEDTLTANGSATITAATPLPSTWSMIVIGFAALGFFAVGGRRRALLLPQPSDQNI